MKLPVLPNTTRWCRWMCEFACTWPKNDFVRILFVACLIAVIIGVAWLYEDSLCLRYVILGLGTMNALYAMCDVMLDGVIHGEETGSDASEMARVFNEYRSEVCHTCNVR